MSRLKIKGELEWLGQRAHNNYKRFFKKLLNRIERRRAKKDPECQPTYKMKKGYMD